MVKPGKLSFPFRAASAGAALCAALSAAPAPVFADWTVVMTRPEGATADTTIAHSQNTDGYVLEIYRDSGGAIRSRFTLDAGLTSLPERSCPTFQIDRWPSINQSLNGAKCLSTDRWAEFILGYVADKKVISPRLLTFLNGINITFRFRLAAGDYRETQFSLLGSKRSMTEAIGTDVVVNAR